MLFSTSTTTVVTITWLTLLAPLVHAGWINNFRPKAPTTPSCGTLICPSVDNAGHKVGVSSTSYNVLFCSYPDKPGQNPNKFYCEYDATTGIQIEDNNSEYCPLHAHMISCPNPKERSSSMGKETPAAQPIELLHGVHHEPVKNHEGL
ncbi:hypothetical protein FRB94_013731 [Tulasnella sp. JGI-2019a]|nr:hypothetical protein FRB94_013731 [Tulasnella sp. JGI-2019a]KAG9009174.1 hypothetical protein FRB93_005670 [Tulasnella sp. JGI-2019a]KAG9038195.1 hypothetical protein FRB95_002635 [Tulasnella sp. JGI-2019a]